MEIHSDGLAYNEANMVRQNKLIREHQTQMLVEWRLLYTTMNLLSLRLDERYAGDANAETAMEELKTIYNNFRKEWNQCQKKK